MNKSLKEIEEKTNKKMEEKTAIGTLFSKA